ncbi:hypothetical protein KKB44_02535 [Candidatus Micrarchaeota archaeon]|nr:hypothetical protein [Candidatus Micrarchaeota archaeon]
MGGSLAQAEEAPREEGTDTLSFIRALDPSREITDSHPTRAEAPAILVDNALRIQELMELVRGERPAEGNAMRGTYDEAVRVLGEGQGRDAALQALDRMLIGVFQTLEQRIRDGDITDRAGFGASVDRFEQLLNSINAGIDTDPDRYLAYDPHINTITSLLTVLQGGSIGAGVREQDEATGQRALPFIDMPLHDLGAIHLISSTDDETIVTVNAEVTPVLTSMFGGQDIAQNSLNQLANAYATLTNHPNDLSQHQQAANLLYEALNQIPQDKEIWNSSVHPHFTAAMEALQRGDLRTALSELTQETSFNAVYGQLNNFYTISVNQTAVAVMRAGVTVRYEFPDNMQRFEEFMAGAREGTLEPAFIWLALGLHYEYLLMSGQLQQFQLELGGEEPTLTQVGSTPLSGTGNVFRVRPEIAIGAGAWGHPIEIVLHADIGYREWAMGADIEMQDGSTQRLEIGDDGAFIGLWGVEVRFPGRTGERSRIRLERVGLGAVGHPENALAYLTLSGTWTEGNVMRIQSFVTPQYSHFLRQHRVGGDIRPADFTFQLDPQWSLYFGPGLRYEYNIGNDSHTFEAYMGAGFRFDRGVELDLRGGYIEGVGGPEGERVPGTGFGGLNLTLTPADWFRSADDTPITRDTVPRRAREEERDE